MAATGVRQRKQGSGSGAATSAGAGAGAGAGNGDGGMADWEQAVHANDRHDVVTPDTGAKKVWPSFNPFVRARMQLFGKLIAIPLGLVLVPVRLILTLLVLIITALYLTVVSLGADLEKPLSPCRRALMRPAVKVCGRCLLFIAGFYWIKERYMEGAAKQRKAPIVICNHMGYIEILFIAARYGACFVSKDANARLPILGRMMRCFQTIFVDRASGQGHTADRIIERTRDHPDLWPPLALFPEGTTTTGKILMKFHTGAFISGVPVQPLVARLPFSQRFGHDPSFTCYKLPWHALGLLSQPVNFLEVTHLPVYQPSEAEQKDAHLYANNVRKAMSQAGKLPLYDLEWTDKFQYELEPKRSKNRAAWKKAHQAAAAAAQAAGPK